jgi:hypothetical protein
MQIPRKRPPTDPPTMTNRGLVKPAMPFISKAACDESCSRENRHPVRIDRCNPSAPLHRAAIDRMHSALRWFGAARMTGCWGRKSGMRQLFQELSLWLPIFNIRVVTSETRFEVARDRFDTRWTCQITPRA